MHLTTVMAKNTFKGNQRLFSKHTFQGKISINIWAVVLVLMLLCGLVFWQVPAIKEGYRSINDINRPSQSALYALKHSVSLTNSALQSFIFYDNDLYRGERNALWDRQVREVIDSLSHYEKKWKNIDDRLLYAELINDLRSLRRLQKSVEDGFEEQVSEEIISFEDDFLDFTADSLLIEQDSLAAVSYVPNPINEDNETIMEGFEAAGIEQINLAGLNFMENANFGGDRNLVAEKGRKINIQRLYQERVEENTLRISLLIDKLHKNQQREINQEIAALQQHENILYGGVVGLLLLGISLVILLSGRLLQHLRASLRHLQEQLEALRQGNIPAIELKSKDETAPLLEDLQVLSNNLRDIKHFAEEVGTGNFETEINIFNNQGEIGSSLISMRQGLLQVAAEDRVRNWTNEGFAIFADILRNNSDVQLLYDQLINTLIKYVRAHQGGIFISVEQSTEVPYLELKSFYAFEKKKYIRQRIEMGQGLVGQCWQEGQTIFLLKVPKDYESIASGLGAEAPRSVMIVPIRDTQQVYGVIELASFHQFTDNERKFVEALGEDIAATISSLKASEQTQNLLGESRQITEKMQTQEQSLLQKINSLDQLKAQLEDKNVEMEAMITAINKATIVIELDEQGNFLYVNDKFTDISLYKTQEIIGKHRSFYAPKDVDPAEFNLMWTQISNGMYLDRNIKRIRKDGAPFWLHAYFFPILDPKTGQLQKVTCIATDISEKVAKESRIIEEQKTLNYKSIALDQAFAVIETDAQFIVKGINSIATALLERSKEDFVGRHIDFAIIGRINFEEVKKKVQVGGTDEGILLFKAGEKDFRYLHVTAVGAKDANLGTLESIFFIATDVTQSQLEQNYSQSRMKVLEKKLNA